MLLQYVAACKVDDQLMLVLYLACLFSLIILGY